jgi:hypothetical protein
MIGFLKNEFKKIIKLKMIQVLFFLIMLIQILFIRANIGYSLFTGYELTIGKLISTQLLCLLYFNIILFVVISVYIFEGDKVWRTNSFYRSLITDKRQLITKIISMALIHIAIIIFIVFFTSVIGYLHPLINNNFSTQLILMQILTICFSTMILSIGGTVLASLSSNVVIGIIPIIALPLFETGVYDYVGNVKFILPFWNVQNILVEMFKNLDAQAFWSLEKITKMNALFSFGFLLIMALVSLIVIYHRRKSYQI